MGGTSVMESSISPGAVIAALETNGVTTDSAARLTEPTLHAWGLDYYLVESDADVGRITEAYQQAQRESRPVAVLVGAEYAGAR